VITKDVEDGHHRGCFQIKFSVRLVNLPEPCDFGPIDLIVAFCAFSSPSKVRLGVLLRVQNQGDRGTIKGGLPKMKCFVFAVPCLVLLSGPSRSDSHLKSKIV
jgi:hypothetical protein